MKYAQTVVMTLTLILGAHPVSAAEGGLNENDHYQIRVWSLVVGSEHLPPQLRAKNFPVGNVPKKELHDLMEVYGRVPGGMSWRKYPWLPLIAGKGQKLDLSEPMPTKLPGGWAGVCGEFTLKPQDEGVVLNGTFEQRILVYRDEEISVPAEKLPIANGQVREDGNLQKFINRLKINKQEAPLRTRIAKLNSLLDSNNYYIQKTTGSSKTSSYVVIELRAAEERAPAPRPRKPPIPPVTHKKTSLKRPNQLPAANKVEDGDASYAI